MAVNLIILVQSPEALQLGWKADESSGADRLAKRKGASTITVALDSTKDSQTLNTELKPAFAKLTKESKIYLLGHSDWKAKNINDKDGKWFAEVLAGIPQVNRVSVLGCSAGRDVGAASAQRVSNAANSFASELHAALDSKNDVYARVFDVKITDIGFKQTIDEDFIKKTWSDLGKPSGNRAASKIRFYWSGVRQMREWVMRNDPAKDSESGIRILAAKNAFA